ncbi:tyrosine-type recombinase/integrase [Serratia marcescens]|uniref:tyrosine-type DNA invertase n=1 Tax=Serratia marcescens TaxID=615 RepID=UPI001EEFDB83|nr:tyrosine-type DNA invertase [Serratia marcescens]ULH10616.1 tyrosine-type recombinase/integrase [Serratia marcescens]
MGKRKYLTGAEVSALLHAISEKKTSRRDWCMVFMAFIHGLRVSELTGLTLADYDQLSQKLHIRRLKGGFSTTHPVLPAEQHALRLWLQERSLWSGHQLPWLFLSGKGGRLTRQRIYTLIREYGLAAGLSIGTHPHMLRHACGYGLAERGNDTRLIQDYLGHKNIRHTVLYTASNAERFSGAWMQTSLPPPNGFLDTEATIPPTPHS